MQPRFTPGPWHPGHLGSDSKCQCANVCDEGYAGGICTIHVDNGLPIIEGGNDAPPPEEAIANMHAIAAVPAMYAALDRQIRNIEHWMETGEAAGPEESKSIYEQLVAARNTALGIKNVD